MGQGWTGRLRSEEEKEEEVVLMGVRLAVGGGGVVVGAASSGALTVQSPGRILLLQLANMRPAAVDTASLYSSCRKGSVWS